MKLKEIRDLTDKELDAICKKSICGRGCPLKAGDTCLKHWVNEEVDLDDYGNESDDM